MKYTLLAALLLSGCQPVAQVTTKPVDVPENIEVQGEMKFEKSSMDTMQRLADSIDRIEKQSQETRSHSHAEPVDLEPVLLPVGRIEGKVDALTEAVRALTPKPVQASKPVQIPVSQPVKATKPKYKHHIILATMHNCPPCKIVEAYLANPASLPGWTVGRGPEFDIEIVDDVARLRELEVAGCPTFVLTRDGKPHSYVVPQEPFDAKAFVNTAVNWLNQQAGE